MRSKWFGPPRLRAKGTFFRPELEALEDRLAPSGSPSGMRGGDDGNHVHVMNNVHNNIHIDNSFNGQNLSFLSFPQSTLQSYFTILYQNAAAINGSAANALVSDEAQLAIDAFLYQHGVSGLGSTISFLQNSIASNPLESSGTGILLGDVTFDLVFGAMINSNLAVGI